MRAPWLLLALAACATAPVTPAARGGEPRFALVYRDAPLFERVDRPPLAMLHPPLQRRIADARLLMPVRVLSDVGDFVQVETVSDERQCVSTPAPFEPLTLRFLVRRADLALVTRRAATARFRDGAAFSLQPGVPLERKQTDAGPMFAFRALDLWFAAPLPADAVGTTFPQPHLDDESPATPFLARHDTVFTYGVTGRAGPLKFGQFASRRTPAGDAVLATLRARCAELTLLARPEDVVESRPGGGLIGALGHASGTSARVRAGAPIFWPDGADAGTVRAETSFEGEGLAREGRRCFEVGGYWLGAPPTWLNQPRTPESSLTVCFRPEDVARVEPSPPAARPLAEPR